MNVYAELTLILSKKKSEALNNIETKNQTEIDKNLEMVSKLKN